MIQQNLIDLISRGSYATQLSRYAQQNSPGTTILYTVPANKKFTLKTSGLQAASYTNFCSLTITDAADVIIQDISVLAAINISPVGHISSPSSDKSFPYGYVIPSGYKIKLIIAAAASVYASAQIFGFEEDN